MFSTLKEIWSRNFEDVLISVKANYKERIFYKRLLNFLRIQSYKKVVASQNAGGDFMGRRQFTTNL